MVMFTGLARVARDAGLTVRETSGWKTRTAHRAGMTAARGILWHHTATAASAVKSRNNPTLNYMINGLGYPLANYGLAWDGSIDVIAAGTGAHAGKGSYNRIPKDQGNYYLIGVEVEGTTGLTWSDAQLESASRLGKALHDEFKDDNFLQIGHNEYAPGRKVDPTGIPGGMNALRAAIKRGYWKNKNWKPGGKVSTGTASSGTSKPKPKKASKPSTSSGKTWPDVALPVTSKHTTASHNAWVYLMRHAVNRTDRNLTINIQRWLRDLGYYKGTVDGQFGPRTVRALQRFLQYKGLYKGVVDGDRGPMTIRAEIAYLNDQRQYLI